MNELIEILNEVLRPIDPISPKMPLLSSGVIDSFRLAIVLSALEARYEIHIDVAKIGVDNFDTPEQMDAFIHARR